MSTLDETMDRLLDLPREAGSPAAAEARALVADHLRGLRYRVEEQPFSFRPSSLNAFPVFGAGLGGLGLLLLPLLTSARLPGWSALLLWVTGLTALVLGAVGIGLGWLPLGGATREDANLIATRGDVPIRRWIVAHLDTKAQAQSMAGRLAAVWVIGIAVLLLTSLAVLRCWVAVPLPLATGGAFTAVLAGALAGRGRLRGTSPGARDNGSGLAAALTAAELGQDPTTGILITGAEEFGLVGARVFVSVAASRLEGAGVVNLDTIDQEGRLYLVSHDARGRRLAVAEAGKLISVGPPLRVRRLPLGILVDSLPFARAGVPAVTIGRLTWDTLRRIHTPGDTREGLSLATAKRVGQALVAN